MPAEWWRAVAPKSLAIAGLAPLSTRYFAVSVCPCRAAWISGVSPVKTPNVVKCWTWGKKTQVVNENNYNPPKSKC